MDFLKSQKVDSVARYAAAGRRHTRLRQEELESQWVAAFCAMAAAPTDADLRSQHTDLDSEFQLRGVEPPYALVKDDVDRFVASVDALVREQQRTDPDERRAAGERLLADFESFEQQRDNAS